MDAVNFKALAVRALKTFVQAAVAVLVVNLANVTNLNNGKAALLAAVAAGVSAVTNLVVKPQEAK